MPTPPLPNKSTVTVTTGGMKNDIALLDAVAIGNGVRSDLTPLDAMGIAASNYNIITNVVAVTAVLYNALKVSGRLDPQTLYVVRE